MKKYADWYDRVGMTEQQTIIAIAQEIDAELSSGGKVISFSVYRFTGMTAAQWKALHRKDTSTGKSVMA